jgi:hypothetical protein
VTRLVAEAGRISDSADGSFGIVAGIKLAWAGVVAFAATALGGCCDACEPIEVRDPGLVSGLAAGFVSGVAFDFNIAAWQPPRSTSAAKVRKTGVFQHLVRAAPMM